MKKLLRLFILIPFIGLSQVQIGQHINGEFTGDSFGASVSLSNDGNIMAIGATHSDGNGSASGHVAIYENQSDTWIQLGNDIVGEASGDLSGRTVSLSGDGSIVAIGTPNNDGNGSSSGHVRIYENLSGTWTQIGTDIDGEAAVDQSGAAISLSDDGNIIAIGAYTNDGNGYGSGHVRIYENQSGEWIQLGSDIDGEAANDESGWSVSLSNDGSIVAIAARWNDGAVYNSGQVRVYENQSGVWTQIGSDIDGEVLGDQLGQSVSLSGNGTLLCVSGIEQSMESAVGYGFIRIYENQSGVWTKIGDDIQQDNQQEYNFASLVTMSDDGDIIAFTSSLSVGLVHIYTLESGVFVPLTTIQNFESQSNLVSSISLSEDGSKIAIGDSYGSANFNYSGNVKVLDLKSELAMLEVVDDILGNNNGINVTASQLNSIINVSGAIEGVDYTTALDNGTFVDENNPTSNEIQAIIDSVNALSLEDIVDFSFKLYPNPTKNQFTIQLDPSVQLENVTIYNTLGQPVLTSNTSTTLSTSENSINTSKLSSGSYIVEILTSKGKASKKLIIK